MRSHVRQRTVTGPTAEELAAIGLEMPLIEAEIDLVDAEIRVLTSEPHPCELDWARLRRAERRVSDAWKQICRAGSLADFSAALRRIAG